MNKILNIQDIKNITGLSRSSIYSRISKGLFPKPINLGSQRSSRWLEIDLNIWLEQLIEERKKSA